VSDRLGLIAGGGRLPLEIGRAAHARSVLAVGFPGITDPGLADVAGELVWHPLGAVEAVLEALRSGGVRDVVLAGKVEKADWLHAPERLAPDARAARALATLDDRSDARLLAAVAGLLEREGFTVLPQAELVQHLLPEAGVLGAVEPTRSARVDLALGWPMAKRLASAGIGQCLVVAGGHVVAVEALEGTDATIERAVELVGGELTVVKVAAPGRDPRFDLPVVGPQTIEPLIGAGRGGLLAIDATSTLILDRTVLIERADRAGIAVVAVGPEGPPPWEADA